MHQTIDPNYAVCRNVKIAMRDGISLSADVYLPATDGVVDAAAKFPIVLVRTPYSKDNPLGMTGMPRHMTQHGYAVVIQDGRGTYTSEGVLTPMFDESWGERQDGADTVGWLLKQGWCDGRVVTTGGSYMGAVQLLLATMGIEGLKTSVVQVPAVNMFGRGWVYTGDMLDLTSAFAWALLTVGIVAARLDPEAQTGLESDAAETGFPLDTAEMFGRLPDIFQLLRGHSLRDVPIARRLPFWQDWLAHRDQPSFFSNNDVRPRYKNVRTPLLHISGWYDLFHRNCIEAYVEITAQGTTKLARDGQRLIVGPWSHIANPTFRQFPECQVDHVAAMSAWFDLCLRGNSHPTFEPRVILYVMGENRWRAEEAWPIPETAATKFYLHSGGHANAASGDGLLSTAKPAAAESPDLFLSNPANPVPSLGGQSLLGGSMDQRFNDDRTDILVYSTPPLDEDIEVTGPIRATLYATSSTTDTDWYIKLIDVFPDGSSYNLVTGAARARYRKSRTLPEPLKPGDVEVYEIDMWSTSNVFKKGHRIRVAIASSDYPNTDLNPNAFIDLSDATEADYVIADQTVFHDALRPSFIELPIIPRVRVRNWISTPFPKTGEGHYYQKEMTEPASIVPDPAPVEVALI